MNTSVKNALEIALSSLRLCYTDKGILAGRRSKKYNQYWARNSFFASYGALAAGDAEQVKKNLQLFASKQHKNGIIANQISRKLKPRFKLLIGSVIDSTALFIISLSEYVKATNDLDFAAEKFGNAKKAMQFLHSKDRNNDFLIEERLFANWAETVLRFGNVLYTNCCYFKAIEEFSQLCDLLDKNLLAAQYKKLAAKTKEKINGMFWYGNYYLDWIYIRKQDFFASDGNLLAIEWGIADKEQSQMILNKIKQHQLNKVPLRTNYPLYPIWRIPITLLPLAAYHYHNGFSWLWLGCLNAVALQKVGWHQDARKELQKVAKLINENGVVHEVFDERGKPVNGLLLQSERPFSWNAGMFVWAVHQLHEKEMRYSEQSVFK
ncbi:MAG: amylo-alpha-1,6-glucosidase [Candidatus Diapherotrites archaeon]|nr:amylo-alpha-1,6-glucosidase [Candidatus Diapherotrites archaeon]